MATQAMPNFTLEEYLKLEREAETRSEYIQGAVVAMAQPTVRHNQIAANALSWINWQLRGQNCAATSSATNLYIEKYDVATYPDVVVTCGPITFLDERKSTINNATVIVEVLSPTTQNYDRGEKFRYYRGLPSFTEYLLLAQDSIRAEHHVRQADGTWLFREITELTSVVALASIRCDLPLAALYEHVQF